MVRWQMDREAPTCYTYSTPTNNWQRKAVKVGRRAECIMMDPCRSRVEEVEESTEPWHPSLGPHSADARMGTVSAQPRWVLAGSPVSQGNHRFLRRPQKARRQQRLLLGNSALSPSNDGSPQSAVCLFTHTSRKNRALLVGRSWGGGGPLAGTEAPFQWVMQENGSLAASEVAAGGAAASAAARKGEQKGDGSEWHMFGLLWRRKRYG